MPAASRAQKPEDEDLRVAALVRVSTEGQAAEGRAGLDRQREVIRRTVEAKRLNVVHWVEMVDQSGASVWTNEKMKGVLRMVLSGEIQGVVVSDLDRLYRPDRPESYGPLQAFQDMGAVIYAGDSEFNLQTADGLLYSSIRGAIAGFELAIIKQRMQGSKEAKRKQGKNPQSDITLARGVGYDRKSESWFWTPEAAKIAELFRLFDEEGIHNYSELGRRLELGTAPCVKVILRNPIYTGVRVVSERRSNRKRVSASGKTYKEKCARDPEDIIRVKVLNGIISEECHKRVLTVMERTKFNHNSKLSETKSVHLGAGICFCGHCCLPIFHRLDKGRGRYVCKSHYFAQRYNGGCKQRGLRADELDAAIDSFVATLLRSPTHLVRILEASFAKTREVVMPFSKAVSPSMRTTELRKRDARLLDAYEKGAIDVDELRTKRETIRKELALMERLQEPKKAASDSDMMKLARVIVKAALRYSKIPDVARKQQIIRSIFAEIHVRDKHLISFRFVPSLLASDSLDAGAVNATILLPKPVLIGPPPDVLPEGHRRCLVCSAVKPLGEYYKNLNRCHPCRKAQESKAYLRRRAAKSATA